MRYDVDVVVLGLGPGGLTVATALGDAGLEVVGVDRRLVGGECPFYGCTPTKMMTRAAGLLVEGRRVDDLAGSSTIVADWKPVAARISDEATHDWTDQPAVHDLASHGVRVVRGEGRLAGRRQVSVDGDTFVARRGVVLGTGTEPAVPPIPGLDSTPYWTNRDVVRLTELPDSLVVIGGGTIGVELCQILQRFGVDVTLLEAAERILEAEEPEASELMYETLTGEGVDVRAGVEIRDVSYADGQFTVAVDEASVTAAAVLVATGRSPNLSDLGLDTVGLDDAAEALETDETLRVQDGLWAVGDITDKGAYTHLAEYQAGVVVSTILGAGAPGRVTRADYRAVPRVTFTEPEIGAVGLTEQQARDEGIRVRTGSADVAESSRGWVHKAGNEGFVKLVEDVDRGVLVGATVAAPFGGEIISLLTLAVHARVPTSVLASMVYGFPTFHQAVLTALTDLGVVPSES